MFPAWARLEAASEKSTILAEANSKMREAAVLLSNSSDATEELAEFVQAAGKEAEPKRRRFLIWKILVAVAVSSTALAGGVANWRSFYEVVMELIELFP